ncbi:MAG: ATP-binding protein [Coriobacteriales bacterium]|jgi:predicted AAA+ superfamily ATPase|nr:ATP-binding protein [Coriobacteriales bacterium]
MQIIERNTDFIRPYIDKPLIKVLTGLRRAGKSTYMSIIKGAFQSISDNDGADIIAPNSNVVHINLEALEHIDVDSPTALLRAISSKLLPSTKYILLDEVQQIDGWERVVNGLLADGKLDIYITGSNSKMLSGELSTLLGGRYVQFLIQTLSFAEYMQFTNASGSFVNYIEVGGFPVLHTANYSSQDAAKIVSDIFDSTILRDTVERHGIRNIDLLKRIIVFVASNIGSTFSAKSVSDYMKSQIRKVDIETVYNYLSHLEEAYIISRVKRYDIVGKQHLKTDEKYYLGDHGFINALFGFSPRYIPGVLENIVYHELIRRGYEVAVGKLGKLEIDFVAWKGDEATYIQVSYLMENEETFAREVEPLKLARASYEKILLTMDKSRLGNYDGIKCRLLEEWLLDSNENRKAS